MSENFASVENENLGKEEYTTTLILNGEEFTRVRVRYYDQGAIYKKDNVYARVAPAEVLEREYETHLFFSNLHFPMPKLLGKGSIEGLAFYLEEDIGTIPFHDSFLAGMLETGSVPDKTFLEFKRVVSEFAEAQIRTVKESQTGLAPDFFVNAFFDDVASESIDFKNKVTKVKSRLTKELNFLPQVPTHGDFNSCNILPGGVIDFAYHFQAPLGYDWTSVLMNTYYFPDKEKVQTEMSREFIYSNSQFEELLDLFDGMYRKVGVEKTFREMLPYLALVRMVWSAAHMEHRPKLQAWRFQKLNAAVDELLNKKGEVNIEKILAILKD